MVLISLIFLRIMSHFVAKWKLNFEFYGIVVRLLSSMEVVVHVYCHVYVSWTLPDDEINANLHLQLSAVCSIFACMTGGQLQPFL